MLSKADKVVVGILEKRQDALFRRVEALRARIAVLPQGTVQIKVRGGRRYAYVQFRDGQDVRCEYRGPVGPYTEKLKRDVRRRRHLAADVRTCSMQLKRVHRALWALTPKRSKAVETPAETMDRNYVHAQYVRRLRAAAAR